MRSWPLAGLLLVLSFFGHDLLMASPAEAAMPAAAADVQTALPHPLSHHDAAAQPSSPVPHHLQDCGVGQRAVSRVRNEFERIPAQLSLHVAGAISAPIPSVSSSWQAPCLPAATRRALLQVYRE